MTKQEEYEVCKLRGHQKSNLRDGEWDICKFCGTHFKWSTVLKEKDRPNG